MESLYYEYDQVKSGIILEKFEFIKSKNIIKNDLSIPKNIHNKIDNNWIHKSQFDRLSDNEKQNMKSHFVNSADFQMIFYVLNYNQKNTDPLFRDNIIIVSEETSRSNDMKVYKKIPDICNIENINCIHLTSFLQNYLNAEINFKIN